MKFITLQTNLKLYKDIIIIEPDTTNLIFSDRSHFVTKLYWSRSEGLIRFDKKNNVYWELVKKI